MKYSHKEEMPREAPKGKGPSDMYAAPGLKAFLSEAMDIGYGKYGEAGCRHDQAKIAPYMMYNDSSDQNGY